MSRDLNPRKIKPISHSLECKFSYELNLIKYESGDHFNEYHYDTRKKNEIATVLIFSPYNKFTGGNLIFKLDDKTLTLNTSEFSNTEYTIVIFSDILHKCEPIISGVRYVFKTTILSEMPKVLSDDCKFKLSDMEKYNFNEPLYGITYKIKDELYNICVLPDYIEDDINNINNYDEFSISYIKSMIQKGYNVVPLYMKFEFKTDFEEGWRKIYGSSPINIDFDDCDNYPQEYNLEYKEQWITNGKQLDYHSEYNDQSGDDIYEEYECTCLLIWK